MELLDGAPPVTLAKRIHHREHVDAAGRVYQLLHIAAADRPTIGIGQQLFDLLVQQPQVDIA